MLASPSAEPTATALAEPVDGAAQPADRRLARRHRRMSAGCAGVERERNGSLLRYANGRDRQNDSGDNAGQNRAALVHHCFEPDLARLEQRRDRAGAAASEFFVVTKSQIDRATGTESRRRQCLDGFQKPQNSDLVVEGPSTPDEPVGYSPVERGVSPTPRVRWYDVHMRDEEHRLRRRIDAGPGIEQAVAPNDLSRQGRAYVGKAGLEQPTQLS